MSSDCSSITDSTAEKLNAGAIILYGMESLNLLVCACQVSSTFQNGQQQLRLVSVGGLLNLNPLFAPGLTAVEGIRRPKRRGQEKPKQF